MKILHLVTGLSIGGAEMMLYKLVTKMNRDKFEIQVISLTDVGPIGERIQDSGILVRALGMKRGVPDPRMVFKLIRWLKKDRPDIVQTWMYHADLIGGLAVRMFGKIPVVWNIRHSNLDQKFNKKTTLWTAKACAKLSNFLPSNIICCSHASKEVHSSLGYKNNKMIVIPNGFDLEVFSPSKDARKKVRRLLGLSDETILIGLIARFDPQKDHKTFFQAAGILHKDYPAVHFMLCGDGVTRDKPIIRKWIDEADVKSVTHLLGCWEDMPSLQAALDMAASSSSYGEGFPNVIGEAMACCVPCVVTDVGDSARIIGNTGLVAPPSNPEALADALERMIDLGEERKKLGMLARKRIEDNYSLEKIVSKYEKIYVGLARNVVQ